MKIEYVELQERIGTTIETIGLEIVPFKGKLSIVYDNKTHYFEIIEMRTDKVNKHWICIKAKEVGYWCNRFDNIKNIDLRNLVGLEINIVTDKETLNKIEKETCWC